MQSKIKYILTILILITLTLSIGGCSVLSPWSPVSPPPSSSTEYTNPNWTFPSANSQAATPLPDIAHVIERAMPSVVSVTTEMIVYDIFQREHTQSAAGSGFLVRSEEGHEGYIVTNNHVVENAQEGSVQVELIDGRTFPAEIIGTDDLADLAVLKIEATNLPYAFRGDSSQLAVGDWVVAIGNALGEGITATHGIVSRLDVSITASGNTLRGLIQTDAAINPGNSGGPLVNIAGEVIGITSAKLAGWGIEGMGYAISINNAEPIIESLVRQGYVTRPWLGVSLYDVTSSIAAMNNLSVNKGALIAEVVDGSPAGLAGLKEGDVIIRFKGNEIGSAGDLIQAIHECQIGQEIEVIFVRGKDTKTTLARLKERPRP